ncbi:MAG: hypothetical protein AAB479_00695 [Patescibacteria group bacterium]
MDPDYIPQLARKEEERLNTLSDTGTFWILIILVLILMAFAVSIFGSKNSSGEAVTDSSQSPTPTESRQPRMYTVSYRVGVFSPTNLRIHAGDTVRFRNDGLFSIYVVSDPHPEHNNVAGFDSIGDVQPGSTFGFTFATKGIFGYHNERNINETGTIMVR